VKFVVDAQLPPRLAKHLVSLGHDAVHVASLPVASGVVAITLLATFLASHLVLFRCGSADDRWPVPCYCTRPPTSRSSSS
jgi:hypothetical protein